MYFADISIVNLGVREAYAHVHHLVVHINSFITRLIIITPVKVVRPKSY